MPITLFNPGLAMTTPGTNNPPPPPVGPAIMDEGGGAIKDEGGTPITEEAD